MIHNTFRYISKSLYYYYLFHLLNENNVWNLTFWLPSFFHFIFILKKGNEVCSMSLISSELISLFGETQSKQMFSHAFNAIRRLIVITVTTLFSPTSFETLKWALAGHVIVLFPNPYLQKHNLVCNASVPLQKCKIKIRLLK